MIVDSDEVLVAGLLARSGLYHRLGQARSQLDRVALLHRGLWQTGGWGFGLLDRVRASREIAPGGSPEPEKSRQTRWHRMVAASPGFFSAEMDIEVVSSSQKAWVLFQRTRLPKVLVGGSTRHRAT